MLFWLQPELATAVEHWPGLFERAPSDYHHDLERQLRDLASGPQVVLVPAEVDALAAYLQRTGRDVADAGTRQAFLEEQVRAGPSRGVATGRNDGCWCGGGTKYKRCCLRA